MSRYFWIFVHKYGEHVRDINSGDRIGRYIAFENVAERNYYVDNLQTEFRTSPGYIEIIKTSGPEFRSYKRKYMKRWNPTYISFAEYHMID